MKRKSILGMGLLAAATLVGAASCNSNSKESAGDSAYAEGYTPASETAVPLDSIAEIFRNPDRKSTVATDSTYAETESGLKYLIIKEGDGKKPTSESNVTVQYEGKLIDGTIFDSSYSRGEPATFPLNRVIPGWTEGLQLMKENGKAIFYIPSDIGYGPQGAPPVIPPNSDLIFTVELLSVD